MHPGLYVGPSYTQVFMVCLVLDNCATHPTAAMQKNIELHFLLPNSTVVVQPLDEGVTMNFKSGYHKHVIN